MNDKFAEVQDCCLDQAKRLLENNAALTEDAVRAAKTLIDIAGDIELLNLHWAAQNRSYAKGGSKTGKAEKSNDADKKPGGNAPPAPYHIPTPPPKSDTYTAREEELKRLERGSAHALKWLALLEARTKI